MESDTLLFNARDLQMPQRSMNGPSERPFQYLCSISIYLSVSTTVISETIIIVGPVLDIQYRYLYTIEKLSYNHATHKTTTCSRQRQIQSIYIHIRITSDNNPIICQMDAAAIGHSAFIDFDYYSLHGACNNRFMWIGNRVVAISTIFHKTIANYNMSGATL